MYRPSSPRHFRSFTSPSSVSTPSLTSAPRRSGNGSSSRMTQHERQEKSDQQENGDDWRGVGNSSRGVPDPFRGQKTDQQWAIHRRTLSHRESLTFTSVPRKIICSLYAPGRTMAATLFGPILGALVTCTVLDRHFRDGIPLIRAFSADSEFHVCIFRVLGQYGHVRGIRRSRNTRGYRDDIVDFVSPRQPDHEVGRALPGGDHLISVRP